MLNRAIARIYASLISALHLIVLLGLGGITIYFFSADAQDARRLLNTLGVSKEIFIVSIIATWVIYVFIIGLLSTIIAINQNIVRLIDAVGDSASKREG